MSKIEPPDMCVIAINTNVFRSRIPTSTVSKGMEPLFTGEQLRDAVLEEREACAKLCNELELSLGDGCESAQIGYWPDQIAHKCAKAIRARGQS